MKNPRPPASKSDDPKHKPTPRPSRKPEPPPSKASSSTAPKSSFELAMERLTAADRESGIERKPLTPDQKKQVDEVRRVATARLAEREILFGDSMRMVQDPAEREKAEREYQIDRQRINDDRERAIGEIHRSNHATLRSKSPSRD